MGKPTWLLDDKQLERLINHDWRTTIRDGEAEAAESLRKPRHIHAATGLSYKQLWKAQEEASNDLWEIILRFSKKSTDKT